VKAFKSSLINIDWMDAKSAEAAAEKVRILLRCFYGSLAYYKVG